MEFPPATPDRPRAPTVHELMARQADLAARADRLPTARAFVVTLAPSPATRKVRYDIARDGTLTARWLP